MWQIFALNALDIVREKQRDDQILAAERRLLGQLDEAPVPGPSMLARLTGAFRKGEPDEHSLTEYPCRLPDGTMGRVAVIMQGGDWALVCRRA
jgi:hypothetical protein